MEGGNVGDLAGNLGVESDGGDGGDAGEIGDIGLPWGWGALAGCLGCGRLGSQRVQAGARRG